MSEPQVVETTVKAVIDNSPKPRADAVVVTPETFNEYVGKMTAKPEAEAEAETPEAKAAAELKKVEDEKAERLSKEKKDKKDAKAEPDEDIDHPDTSKKAKLNERFSELTAKRKEAEAKVEAERQAREAAERQIAELKAKYEPPKSDELGPKPEVGQFTNIDEFSKALEDWSAEKARKEDAQARAAEQQKHEREKQVKEWGERETEVRKRIEDYDDVVNKSTVRVSDQLKAALLESEVGPEIAYHLATHPDVAENLAKMTVGRMLKEVGRIEATLQGKAAPPALKVVPKVEISKAPEPISPVRTNGEPIQRLNGHQEVPKAMDYETWKKLRREGKIN